MGLRSILKSTAKGVVKTAVKGAIKVPYYAVTGQLCDNIVGPHGIRHDLKQGLADAITSDKHWLEDQDS